MRRLWEQIVVGAYRVCECSLGWDSAAPAARAHLGWGGIVLCGCASANSNVVARATRTPWTVVIHGLISPAQGSRKYPPHSSLRRNPRTPYQIDQLMSATVKGTPVVRLINT